jgi:hypothetical protein
LKERGQVPASTNKAEPAAGKAREDHQLTQQKSQKTVAVVAVRPAGADKPKQEAPKSSGTAEQERRQAMVVLLSAAVEEAEQERPQEIEVVVVVMETMPAVGGRAEVAIRRRLRRPLPGTAGGSFAGAQR